MKFLKQRLTLIFGVILVILVVDQVTKVIARDALGGGQIYSYLGHTIVLSHSENRGAFLSLGSNLGEEFQFWFFTVFVGLFLVGLTAYLVRQRSMDRFTTFSMSLVVAGGIGNLIDRAWRGSVTDFLNFGIGATFRTGILNVADMAITFGVIVILLQSFKKEKA